MFSNCVAECRIVINMFYNRKPGHLVNCFCSRFNVHVQRKYFGAKLLIKFSFQTVLLNVELLLICFYNRKPGRLVNCFCLRFNVHVQREYFSAKLLIKF